ncbi:MAG TPA: four helix bundle protein, partial [Terriglobia bacterium]|nr:four helix bundle protein [Terriglobia bacterium]
MEVKFYRDLLVWQRAMDLVIQCYEFTERFPKSELYGLASQIQRAVTSIPANIAEGHGRDHLGDYLHHLSIASGPGTFDWCRINDEKSLPASSSPAGLQSEKRAYHGTFPRRHKLGAAGG